MKKAGGKIDSAFKDDCGFGFERSPFETNNAFGYFFICPSLLFSRRS